MTRHTALLAGAFLVLAAGRLEAQPSLMEDLGRGIVAVRSTATEVFVSWRVLGTDRPTSRSICIARPAAPIRSA
jgi:hypothetical protein